MTRLIVGLGNPGRQYARNRHNAGFKCLDALARAHGISLRSREGRAQTGRGEIGGQELILAKPLTYMNRSGGAVAALLRRHQIAPDQILVIYDDLALPLGRIRIRERGSSGGHNGVKSIIDALGTDEFPRLRVGIGPPPEGDTAPFVLSDFSPEEQRLFARVRKTVVEAVECVVTDGLERAMNRYN